MPEEITEEITEQAQVQEEPVVLPSDEKPEEKPEGKGGQETKPKEQVEEQKQDEVLEEVEQSTGLDISALEQEFTDNGELSDKSYEILAKAGLPREIVDRYIEGRKAFVAQYDNQIYSLAGGEQEFKAMIDWAKDNLTEPEKIAYNNAVNSRNIELAKMATEGLLSRYKQSGNNNPVKQIEGQITNNSGSYYNSMAELVSDQKDKRYETDPRYRQAVEEKLKRSIDAGFI